MKDPTEETFREPYHFFTVGNHSFRNTLSVDNNNSIILYTALSRSTPI